LVPKQLIKILITKSGFMNLNWRIFGPQINDPASLLSSFHLRQDYEGQDGGQAFEKLSAVRPSALSSGPKGSQLSAN
jgi:hypothetical protein